MRPPADPMMPFYLVGAALAVALVVIYWLGRRRGLATAGIVLIAMTPLVPTARIPNGLGVSSDDILPVLGLATIVLALWRGRRSSPRESMSVSVLGPLRLVLVVGLALIVVGGVLSGFVNGQDPQDTVRLILRGSGRFAFLGAIVVAVGLAVRQTPSLVRTAATAIAGMGAAEAAFGLFAYVVPLPGKIGLEAARKETILFGEIPGRVSGTLGISPDFTGTVLMVALIVTVGLALSSAGRTQRLWLAIAGLQLVTLALTFARTPLAIAVAAVAVLLLLARRPILVLPFAAVAGIAAVVTPLGARFISDSHDRIALWTAATRLFADHPLAGVGPGQMLAVMRTNPERYLHTDAGRATNNAHNTILLAAAEMGVLAGIGAFLVNAALTLLSLRTILDGYRAQPRSELAIAGGLAVIAVLLQGMVNNLFTVGATSVMLALVAGIFVVGRPATSAEPAEVQPDPVAPSATA